MADKYAIIIWFVDHMPSYYDFADKEKLKEYFLKKYDKNDKRHRMSKFFNADSQWFDETGNVGLRQETLSDYAHDEIEAQVKAGDDGAIARAEGHGFNDIVSDIEKLFKNAKSQIIRDAKDIRSRRDADKIYEEIDKLPEGPDRDAQIVELRDLVNDNFLSLEEEFMLKIDREDNIDELRRMRDDSLTSKTDEAISSRISDLQRG